jgi:hypothetical protein
MIIADLGNSQYKIIVGDKKIKDSSNVQCVSNDTFGAFEIDGKYYLFGEGAKTKKNTNKICEEKRALLGRALFPIVADKEKVDLTTLLPLSLYVNQENKKRYAQLLKGKYVVTNSNGAKKTFTVSNVDVCCESFSSLVTDSNLLKQALYLVDIGGVDVCGVLVNRTPDINKMFTAEKGMNILNIELAKVLTSKLLETYTDKDVELLLNDFDNLPQNYKAIIDDFMKDYIQTNIYESLKDIGYKPLIHKLVFCGGGSTALERYLSKDENSTILEDAIYTNVLGAKILSTRRSK